METLISPVPVANIRELKTRGPWTTKSGGELTLVFAMGMNTPFWREYFNYDKCETPQDIRGFRIYAVRNLPRGGVGGKEFHRVREEIVFGLDGGVRWECEDVWGKKREFVVTPNCGIWIPSTILHSYEVVEKGSGLLVLANTLFDPADPGTHDTYSIEEFRALQQSHQG